MKKKATKKQRMQNVQEKMLSQKVRERARDPYGISKDTRGHRALDIQHNGELQQHEGEYIKQVLCQERTFCIEKLKTGLVGLESWDKRWHDQKGDRGHGRERQSHFEVTLFFFF